MKFFLGKNDSSFSFSNEEDTVTWESAKIRNIAAAETLTSDMPSSSSSYLDVSDVRTVMISIQPSDNTATYDLAFINFPLVLPSGDRVASIMEETTGLSNNRTFKLDVHGIDFLYVMATAISAGTLDVYIGKIVIEE